VLSCVGSAGDSPAASAKPNILFILTDDHRWDALSSMGHPFIKTPNLDKIADEGILFGNAFVTTSLCSPSRASFLTGQYAHRHGVVTNHTPWDNRNVTFLELLNKEGYDTAFIGKWHMPGEGLPKLRGVDHFVSFTAEGGQGIYYNCPLVIDGVETQRPGKYITEHFPVFPIPIPGITAIRTGQYKYIEYQDDIRPREVFDLKTDPREMNNLIETEEGKILHEKLKRELERLKRVTGYRFFTHG
jgi:arylsulfatase A-like enzyme